MPQSSKFAMAAFLEGGISGQSSILIEKVDRARGKKTNSEKKKHVHGGVVD